MNAESNNTTCVENESSSKSSDTITLNIGEHTQSHANGPCQLELVIDASVIAKKQIKVNDIPAENLFFENLCDLGFFADSCLKNNLKFWIEGCKRKNGNPTKRDYMRPEHPRWIEFLYRLCLALEVKVCQEEPGKTSWCCDRTLATARRVAEEDMGEFFDESDFGPHGAFCSCEILLNMWRDE